MVRSVISSTLGLNTASSEFPLRERRRRSQGEYCTERLVPRKESFAAKAIPKVNPSPTATVESEQGE